MRTVGLGLLLFSDYTIAELADLAVLAEELGYRDFWYTDVRFARDCYLGLAAAAARTRRIRLGTGVTDPYSRHPALTAAAIATLDEMSGGRAVLGLGTGGTGFRELGIEQALPVAALRETVSLVRGLLSGEKVTQQGKVVSLGGAALGFAPPRPGLPIYFATHGSQITRLAAQVADGVLIANTLNPAAFGHYVAQLEQGFAKSARDASRFDIGLRVEACIADDDAAAFDVMRRRVASRVLSQYPHWDYLRELGIELPAEFAALAAERPDGYVQRATPLMPDAVVESMVLAGSPDRVARQLAQALHPRITTVTLRPHALKGQSVAPVIRAFAEQVLPQALRLGERLAAE
jgi:5,10-methylenetetrahydromethanopterin reductase